MLVEKKYFQRQKYLSPSNPKDTDDLLSDVDSSIIFSAKIKRLEKTEKKKEKKKIQFVFRSNLTDPSSKIDYSSLVFFCHQMACRSSQEKRNKKRVSSSHTTNPLY